MARRTLLNRRGVRKATVAIATAVALCAAPIASRDAEARVMDKSCPADAISVVPGAFIQASVDRAGADAAFCLKNGIHRIQVIRPKPRQAFYGEGQTVLNGSRLLTTFTRNGAFWIAGGQEQHGRSRGECEKSSPACNLPEGVFIDDTPLVQVRTKDTLRPGQFYFDHRAGSIYLADDPTGRKVEATVAAFAFESAAPGVRINNITVEKYATVAQKGAIHAQEGLGWVIEACEVRLNSGAGIGVGVGSRVRDCNIHHNGQIGITGAGSDIRIEENYLWMNNIRGFSSNWESGGAKLAEGTGIVFRGNQVVGNFGPGLWCDINCREVLYENNVVENNHGAGIIHEISFSAVIRRNSVRRNAIGDPREWFWGNDILVAASQDVEVYENRLTVSPDRCGIMIIDQSRLYEGQLTGRGKYKSRNISVHDNQITFEGSACAGGASDASPGDENFSIITEGNNKFDRNLYRVPHGAGSQRFAWGHATLDWDGLRRQGLERNGQLVFY